MIKGFEQPHPTEPIRKSHWQGWPAIAAALIAGVILLIVPHASPWEGLTTFNPAFMGRVPPPAWNLGIILIVLIHLALSVIYGFIISIAVLNIHELRAVFVGGVVGLMLLKWMETTSWPVNFWCVGVEFERGYGMLCRFERRSSRCLQSSNASATNLTLSCSAVCGNKPRNK